MPEAEPGVNAVAPLSKVRTIDVPFVFGELCLPEFAFVESVYKAAKDSKGSFKDNLRKETAALRYAGIPETITAQGEKELALEKAYRDGIFTRPRETGSYSNKSGMYYKPTDGMIAALLGYVTQKIGGDFDIDKISRLVGTDNLPDEFKAAANYTKGGLGIGEVVKYILLDHIREERKSNQGGCA